MESLIITFTTKYKDMIKHKKLDYAEFKAIQCSLLIDGEIVVSNSSSEDYDFIKSDTYILSTKDFSRNTLLIHLKHFTENQDVSGFYKFVKLLEFTD